MVGFNNYLTYLDVIKQENIGDFVFHSNAGKLRHSFVFLFRGTADYYTEDGVIHLKAGDAIFIPTGSKYSSEFCGNGDIYYINLICLFSPEYPECNGITHKLTMQKLDLSGVCSQTDIEKLYEMSHTDGFKTIEMFYQIYSKLTDRMKYIQQNTGVDLLSPALSYIDGHFCENFSVFQLAELCNISEPYFFRLFRERTGTSPIEYRNRMRIRKAMDELDTTNETVSLISEKLGFSTDEFFSRTFKRLMHMSPTEYRMRMKDKKQGL